MCTENCVGINTLLSLILCVGNYASMANKQPTDFSNMAKEYGLIKVMAALVTVEEIDHFSADYAWMVFKVAELLKHDNMTHYMDDLKQVLKYIVLKFKNLVKQDFIR